MVTEPRRVFLGSAGPAIHVGCGNTYWQLQTTWQGLTSHQFLLYMLAVKYIAELAYLSDQKASQLQTAMMCSMQNQGGEHAYVRQDAVFAC